MHHSESGDKTPNERIGGHHRHRRAAVQKRIERPEASPGNDQEEETGFDAVEREKEGHRHSGRL